MSDEILLNGLRRKQPTAMGLLYDKYAASVYGIIKASVPDEKAAADLLMQCFCSAWHTSNAYDPQRMRLFTWLFQLAKAEIENYSKGTYYPEPGNKNPANLTIPNLTLI
jgi:DNA-directed RNA polymerase specialized sigma24 family protein